MSSPVVTKPAIPAVYFTDDVKNTVKLFCKQRAGIQDVLMLLRANGVEPEEVKSAATGHPGDPAIYVGFTNKKSVDNLTGAETLKYRNLEFQVVALDAQVISLRCHWLPTYISDAYMKRVFSEYGKVLDVDRQTFRGLETGLRTVRLEVSEAERLALPHLMKFECGTSMLVTVQGRPPLCLRCQKVGHVRRDCPLTQRSYVSDTTRRQEPQRLPQTQEKQTPQPQRPLVDDADNDDDDVVKEPTVNQEQQPQLTESTEPDEEQQLPLDSSQDDVSLVIDENSPPTPLNDVANENDDVVSELMEVVTPSLKRSLSEGETDSFAAEFPRQKVVRSTSLETANKYQVLEDLSALLEDV